MRAQTVAGEARPATAQLRSTPAGAQQSWLAGAGWCTVRSAPAAYDRASAPELSPAARPLVAAHAPLSGGDFHAHFSSSCAPRAKLTNGRRHQVAIDH